ncbi:MAG: ABC transporter ATP-binding protein [Patescibacteria group bacterium]
MQIKNENKTEKAEIKRGIRAIWRHISPFKNQLTFLVALGLISAMANGAVPYVTGRFFDALVDLSQNEGSVGLGNLPVWVIFLAIWTIIQLIANNIDWVMDRLRRNVDDKVHFNILAEGFVHLLQLPLSYHKNVHINGELQKISHAGWRISAILRTIIQIAPQFLSIVIGIVLAASINVMLAGVLLAGVVLYTLLLVRILLPIASIDFAAHKVWNESWDDSAAAIQQIESVKQATAEPYESKRVKNSFLEKTYFLWQKIEKNWSNVSFFQRTIVFFTQLTVFIFSVKLISTGVISVGELVALNGYALMFFGPFVQLGYSWQTIQNGITSATRAEDIFETEPEKYTPINAVKLGKIRGEVNFKNVSFKYTKEQPEILKSINFTVSPGEIVALVGESGVGKSTSISLISGYYFPTNGEVLIDGLNVKNLNLHDLRKQIGVVPQEVALFNDTIETNIRYGSFDANEENIKRVVKEVHLDEFIATLPEGYKTLVGERGIKLSVGQKQRISIARAMLRKPAILILDEPTSALDAQTERTVTEALERLMQDRTTFIIAHRLSTVRKADKILVFQKGEIVEIGTHDKLIKKKGGVYRHLYEYQVGLH